MLYVKYFLDFVNSYLEKYLDTELIQEYWPASLNRYRVMQLDWNSYCGDAVLDNFNMAYRDEDSYRKKY